MFPSPAPRSFRAPLLLAAAAALVVSSSLAAPAHASGLIEEVGKTAKKVVKTGKRAVRSARRVVRRAVRGARRAAQEVGRGVKTVGRGLSKGAKNLAKGKVGKAAESVGKGVVEGGKKLAKGVAKGVTSAVKLSFDLVKKVTRPALKVLLKKGCDTLVKLLMAGPSLGSLMKQFKALAPVSTCSEQLVRGFVCSIPQLLLDMQELDQEIADATWKHKEVCLPAAVVAAIPATAMMLVPGAGIGTAALPFAAPVACGAAFWTAKRLQKGLVCLKSMSMQVGKVDWMAIGKTVAANACQMVGDFAFDIASSIVMSAATQGFGLPLAIGKSIAKIAKVVTKAQKVVGYVEKAVDAANQLRAMGSCQ